MNCSPAAIRTASETNGPSPAITSTEDTAPSSPTRSSNSTTCGPRAGSAPSGHTITGGVDRIGSTRPAAAAAACPSVAPVGWGSPAYASAVQSHM